MRRFALFSGLLIISLFAVCARLSAQETAEPAARHQDSDENYKILSAKLEDLAVANESLKLEVTRLKEALQRVADEVSAGKDRPKEFATLESIKQLKSAIEEVDSKRIADQKLVVSEFENLRKLLEKSLTAKTTPGAGSGHKAAPPTTAHTDPKSTVPEKGYNYKIQDGDTLSAIVAALRTQGMKISAKQIQDANPAVNWNKLKINQTIFIPSPAAP